MAKGKLEKLLEGKDFKARCKLKAQAYANVFKDSLEFTVEGVDFLVAFPRVVEKEVEGQQVTVFVLEVAARDSAGDLPLDNPYEWVNPPIKHDGSEDLAGAMKQAVADAVFTVARQRGWRP